MFMVVKNNIGNSNSNLKFITPLNPLNNSNNKSNTLCFYADFETVVYNEKHYVICYSLVDSDFKTISGSIDLDEFVNVKEECTEKKLKDESFKVVKEFLARCFGFAAMKKDKRYCFFFHNLNRFDLYFIFNQINVDGSEYEFNLITKDQIFYKIEMTNSKNVRIEFRDSYLYMPISLADIGDIFREKNKEILKKDGLSNENLCESGKGDFKPQEHNLEKYLNDRNSFVKLLKHCENDSRVLAVGFNKFCSDVQSEFQINLLSNKILSISGLAMNYFRRSHLKEFSIEKLNENKDQFIRESYFGGLVNVFKPFLTNGYYYDVNSLYPYSMLNNMPTGRGEWINDKNINLNEFFGFAKVKVFSPKEMDKPFLFCADNDLGTISPLGTWTGVYFSEEIKYAMSLGYTFEFIRGVSYKKDKSVFESYVNKIYGIRSKTEKGSPLNTISKLLLNSLYGRFGMKTDKIRTEIVDDELLNYYLVYYHVHHHWPIGKKHIVNFTSNFSKEKLDYLLKNNHIEKEDYDYQTSVGFFQNESSAVHIASAITAYSRIYMHKFICDKNLDVHYSDTDSIFCQNPLEEKYVSQNKLGAFKLEGKIKEAFFISPKQYAFNYEHDNIDRIIIKGFPKDIVSKEQLKRFLEKDYSETQSFPFTNAFLRNKRTFEITSKSVSRSLSGIFLKREKVFKGNIWVNTKPLIIKKE